MTEAASRIAGLHHKKAFGPQTQTIFMGWDATAVEEAAKGHAAEETKRLQDEENERQSEREKMHTDYLNTLTQPKGRAKALKHLTPVGSYIIDSEDIEQQYRDLADDLGLDIDHTDMPGVFKAEFDFGILEGVCDHLCPEIRPGGILLRS
jgi:hypothetical protein